MSIKNSGLMKADQEKRLKQSDNMAASRYSATLLGQRILYVICASQPRSVGDSMSVRLSVRELADAIGIESENRYSKIKSVSNSLMMRLVTIPTDDGGEYTSHWLQARRYYPEDSSVEFWLDPKLRDEYLKLRQAYVDAPIGLLLAFKRTYSARIYMLLTKWLRTGRFETPLEFFVKKFELGKTYEHFSHLKNGVLEPCLKEINEKSDLNVKWEYIKEGRSYTKIRFLVSKKASLGTV